MIIRKVFISYNEADKKYANKIRLWAKRGMCCAPDQRVITLVEHEKIRPPSPRQQPPPSVGMKILMSDFVIVLIGNNNENHPWLAREEVAAQKNVVRYYVRIPYADGALPETFSEMKQLAYNPNAIELIFRDLPEKPPIVFKKAPFKKPYQGDGNYKKREQGNYQRNDSGEKRTSESSEQGSHSHQKDTQQRSSRPYGSGGYKPYHDSNKPRTNYIKRETLPPPPPPPPTEPPLLKDNDIGLEW